MGRKRVEHRKRNPIAKQLLTDKQFRPRTHKVPKPKRYTIDDAITELEEDYADRYESRQPISGAFEEGARRGECGPDQPERDGAESPDWQEAQGKEEVK
jgi:hypothetical protein